MNDSFDQLNLDFSKYIRELQRKKAHLSIFLLVDQFISITKIFALSSDEYLYFQNKYRSSELSNKDLTQTEIVMYLKEIIERLEKITGKTFKAEQLKKISSEGWEDESDFTELQKLKDDISQFPDLIEIFKETVVNISETSRENLKKPPKVKQIPKTQNDNEPAKAKQIHKTQNAHFTPESYTLTPIPKRPSSEKTDDWVEWSSGTSPINLSESSQNKTFEQKNNKKTKSSKDDPDLMNILSDFDQKNKESKNSENLDNSVVSLEDLAFKKKVPNFKDKENK